MKQNKKKKSSLMIQIFQERKSDDQTLINLQKTTHEYTNYKVLLTNYTIWKISISWDWVEESRDRHIFKK